MVRGSVRPVDVRNYRRVPGRGGTRDASWRARWKGSRGESQRTLCLGTRHQQARRHRQQALTFHRGVQRFLCGRAASAYRAGVARWAKDRTWPRVLITQSERSCSQDELWLPISTHRAHTLTTPTRHSNSGHCSASALGLWPAGNSAEDRSPEDRNPRNAMTLMRTAPYPARRVDPEAHSGRHFESFRDYVEALKGIGEIQEIDQPV